MHLRTGEKHERVLVITPIRSGHIAALTGALRRAPASEGVATSPNEMVNRDDGQKGM